MAMKGFLQKTAEYFKAHEGQWVRASVLQVVGGQQASRTRISECRTQLGMTIENRCRRVMQRSGEMVTVSEYRYVPRQAPARDTLPLLEGAAQ